MAQYGPPRKVTTLGKGEGIPPRERILAVATDLFNRHGIRAVGVESIADVAGTNKMTLYRHFASKDELVVEYLRRLADKASSSWNKLAGQHLGDPRGQLRAWLEDMADHVESGDERGCPLANAAVELAEKDHPARRVIEAFKNTQRDRIIALCAAAGLAEPELLGDELFLLLEGLHVTAQSMGHAGLGDRLIRMGEILRRRYPSAFFIRSGVNGVWRIRTPVSCITALEIAGATSGVAIWPTPVG